MLEVVDLASLRRYAAQQEDRRPDCVDAYIDRLEREGQKQGNYVTLRVQYYRKHGLPGRLYAIGPSLQKLTKEARAAAMDGFTYALDACNCFPSLLVEMLERDPRGAKVTGERARRARSVDARVHARQPLPPNSHCRIRRLRFPGALGFFI